MMRLVSVLYLPFDDILIIRVADDRGGGLEGVQKVAHTQDTEEQGR